MYCRNLVFSRHALERMLERRISPDDVRRIVDGCEVVESYPNDQPFPANLLLGRLGGGALRPLHVVLGYDTSTETGYVITTYIPDPAIWQADWKTRR